MPPHPIQSTFLCHCTPYYQLRDVQSQGLRCALSRGARARVWVCSEEIVHPIMEHLLHDRSMNVLCFAVLRVEIKPGIKLVRSGRTGVWCVTCDIPPDAIELMYTTWKFASGLFD